MSLVNLAHVCSHLQNASKARLGTTSIPFTRLHTHLSHQLQKSGFVSTVTIGGSTPPPASSLLAHPPVPPTIDRNPPTDAALDMRHRELGPLHKPPPDQKEPEVWELYSLPENIEQPDYAAEHVPLNPAQRRLWLGLKYWNNEPVLGTMRMVSKPTRRIWMGAEQLMAVSKGRTMGMVHGMRQIGECLYVSTDRGIMEVRECVERGLGGMLLCRAW